jgi:hypothetical protein
MGSSTQTQQQQSSSGPWANSIPHLNNIMGQGESLYNQGLQGQHGMTPNPYIQQAPLDPKIAQAQYGIYNTAATDAGSGANYQPWNAAMGQINSGGLSADMQSQIGKLQGMADGGITNPYLESMLDTQANKLRNQVSSTYSGAGRYGGASHQGAVVDRIAEAQNPIRFQAYESDQNRKLAANQTILGAQGQGAQRALGYSALAPELDRMKYSPYERIGAIGDFNQGRTQTEWDLARDKYDKASMAPWENLARYGAALGYTSPFAANSGDKTTTGTTKTPTSFMDYMKLFTPNAGGFSTAGALTGLLGL